MPQLLSNLTTGAKVKFGSLYGSPIIWKIVGKGHTGYPSGSITFLAERIIKLMCVDAKESGSADSNRRDYGNNRYIYSNIRQWLNSQAAAGAWYAAQHATDAPPNNANVWSNNNEYDAIAGFLNAFTANERNALLSTTLTVGKASYDGGGTEQFTDKVFLLSPTEVGLTGDFTEGTKLAAFSDNNSRIAYPTAAAVSNSEYTSGSLSSTQPWYYWLRSPYASFSCYVRFVGSGGALGSDDACSGDGGLRPAFNLSSSLLVSDSTDTDGCYTFVWNAAPTTPSNINVPTSVYGGKTASISWGSSTDPDGNLAGYILQRSVNGGAWTEVYRGTALTYTDSITFGWTTVAYRICAYDTVGAQSGYTTSATRIVINNQAPVISGIDSNLGVKTTGFTQNYTVTDADSDAVTVTERIDGVSLRSYMVTLGATNAFSVTGTTWLKQSNGSHTMTITAVDAFGNTVVRTYTFTKNVTSFSVQNTTPMTSDTRPTRIRISVTRNIPAEASFTVYVCNNGFDASPTWEDATTSVTGSLIHIFENTAKVAATWGVIIKVEVSRNTADGACYVSQIGGNFE